ncbi:hypothetical protein DLH72_02515 [Candidatus Gracilibacteria bacterium]|nr:MAG: hypothetical protein DLH72_02515 [Candidatus Gracilibacteria bacterium]
MKKKKAFSLIEIIVSIGIISVTIFGIYKLIGENNKIIANSNIFLIQNLLYDNAKECLNGENFDNIFIDFGDDLKSCNFSNSEKITKIDNVEYIIQAKSQKSGTKVIFWKINIESNILGKGGEKTFKE